VAPNVPILLVKDACEPLRKTCANEANKVIGIQSIEGGYTSHYAITRNGTSSTILADFFGSCVAIFYGSAGMLAAEAG
jgi:hypothetical protein